MYVPTASTTSAATLRDFTIEHVRVIVPPQHAHTTALSLVSGMLPPAPTSSRDANMLNMALRWFGNHLYPLPAPDNYLSSSRMTRMRASRRCVQQLADTDTACVLDLVAVAHTAAVQQRKGRRDTAVCGFATMSVSPGAGAPYVSPRAMRYEDGQLCIPFAATNSTTPRDTLDTLRRALELAGIVSPDHTVPLTALAAGRIGYRSDSDRATCTRFAHFASDDHDVWEIRPATVGADLAYDARIAGLSDRAHYRVFEAWPADPFEGV